MNIHVKRELIKCHRCGKKNAFYNLPDFACGERLVQYGDGTRYAHINLIEDSVYTEFTDRLEFVLNLHHKQYSTIESCGITDQIFGIACDKIDGYDISFAYVPYKCIYCGSEEFENSLAEPESPACIDVEAITHNAWNLLNDVEKTSLIESELIKNKYLDTMKIGVAREVVKCRRCKKKNTFYYLSDFAYGEKLVQYGGDNRYAYINLIEDGVYDEFIDKLKLILNSYHKHYSIMETSNIIDQVFGIACDRIDGYDISFAYRRNKCVYCGAEEFESILAEPGGPEQIDVIAITHNAWNLLSDDEKIALIESALIKNNYIDE